MTPIDKRIKELGLKKGWVAEKSKVSKSALSLICNGRSDPSIKVALRLARVLNTTVEDLWGHLIEQK
ncbi:DNA-binding XRE family transcriptional regulator [Pullulanibacillus pueri]|uniref:HTH cro/C1-type domain-containing protein n=1 Tax=Pullulanibacillus pueri TaxID=1437324 RepID=A0A8J2ZXM0_9BACL|nr:helix-turn-helix transcriptional regulator [Pullulanibacillus pueri]MBM7681919.1 DNA-binding XRE family transcriptional regulator [Pullulanibacillus pueri]GGH83444.1 hypothetical protein GCM10007096_24320 [Pullulanibacillus pueri]